MGNARDEQLDRERMEMGVGVGDDHELVPGSAEPQIQPLRLAAVDRVEEDFDAFVPLRCAGCHRHGPVRGAVVEHEDLEVRVLHRPCGPDVRADHALLVVRGHEDRHAWPAAVRLDGIPPLLEDSEDDASAHPDPGRHDREEHDVRDQEVSDEAQLLVPPGGDVPARTGASRFPGGTILLR